MRHSDQNLLPPNGKLRDLDRHELQNAVMSFKVTSSLLRNHWEAAYQDGLNCPEGKVLQSRLQTRNLNSLEYLISSVTPDEVAKWYDTMNEVASLIEGTKPDIIFCPMRGSSPFIVALRKMMPATFSHIPMIPLAVGSIAYFKDEKLSNGASKLDYFGLNRTQKSAVIQSQLNILRGVEFDNPLVIDEVQSGSTSIRTTLAVQAELGKLQNKNIPITLIGIEDNRDIRKEKVPEYTSAIDGSIPALRLHRVAAPLFHVDSVQFIDPILFTSQTNINSTPSHEQLVDRPNFADYLTFVPNQNGRRAIEALAVAYCDLKSSREVIRCLRTGDTEDLSKIRQLKPKMGIFIDMLVGYLNEATSPKNLKLHEPANVFKWMQSFIDKIEDRSLS